MNENQTAVLVTTLHKGVFFGFANNDDLARKSKEVLTLYRVRNCIWWDKSIGGFLGLAAIGPNDSCRIGSEAPECDVFDITSITKVTKIGVEAWTTAKIM